MGHAVVKYWVSGLSGHPDTPRIAAYAAYVQLLPGARLGLVSHGSKVFIHVVSYVHISIL